MSDLDDRIGLALSGGGFRATLFHLGVIRFLSENGLLKQVKLVSAVSGGSILAAHLILNWERYISVEDFDAAASEVLNFVKTDIRGRVLRRWLLGCSTLLPRFATSKEGRWSLVNLLQRQYADLYRSAAKDREATIGDLRRNGRPAVRLNCTSLTTGEPCYFDQAGFGWYKDGVIENGYLRLACRWPMRSRLLRLSRPCFHQLRFRISHYRLIEVFLVTSSVSQMGESTTT